jgi:hypothetical protein
MTAPTFYIFSLPFHDTFEVAEFLTSLEPKTLLQFDGATIMYGLLPFALIRAVPCGMNVDLSLRFIF